MEKTNFTRFSLKPFLYEGLENMGFYDPTDIQERVIPKALKGLSLVGQSQTGTGKTHAFLLPILTKLNPSIQSVQAVITAPTRELAHQIYHEVLKLTKYCPKDEEITAKLFVGGTDKARVIEKLKVQPHIVIGTPGRIYDLMKEQALFVHTANMLVVDEADLMLDLGFLEDVDRIAGAMPEQLQMFVFSATIPENLKPFLKKYMENPEFVHVEPKQKTAKNIEHILLPLRHRDKFDFLKNLMEIIHPYLAIIFVNTKAKADELANLLAENGVEVGLIHGNLTPRERKKMMSQIRNLEYQYIVATDLASRGIDIEGVSHVFHYELPKDLNFYIHRSGRTGRGAFTGVSYILLDEQDNEKISKLENMGITFNYMDIVAGELKEIEDRNQRKNRKRKPQEVDIQVKRAIKKPKKVKPGYKKKQKELLEKEKKRQLKKLGRPRH
ncbi:DEAD/DEAH box helicase [Caldifermentibacillus hisashii]|uniref:DEAD/DEAH box helicase n=1 Tax=Caldifermentibacillus hisashii TaxID=996558 RepID=UPI0034D5D39D